MGASRLEPAAEREALLGDLHEEHSLRSAAGSPTAARTWLRRQLCASILHFAWCRAKAVAWISTAGVAVLAYVAIGVIDYLIKRGVAVSPVAGLLLTFIAATLVAYVAGLLRRGAPIVLATMLLLAIIVMTLSASGSGPWWQRLGYFLLGPVTASMATGLHAVTHRDKRRRR